MTKEQYITRITEAKRIVDIANLLDKADTERAYNLMSQTDYDLVEYVAAKRANVIAMQKRIVPFEVNGDTYYAQESGKEVRIWTGHGKLLKACESWQEVLEWANDLNGKVA